MTRNGKIFLGCLVALLVLCLCSGAASVVFLTSVGWGMARTFESNPAQVADMADNIAEFDLPAGYRPDFGMSLFAYSFVAYSAGDFHSHIMFMQFPTSVNLVQREVERQVRRATRGRSDWEYTRVAVIDEVSAVIHGEEVKVTIGEGVNSDGETYRQITTIFQGKGGPTLLVVEEPVSKWDQATVDAFLASIR